MSEPVELANADDNVCFACGPDNPMGLQLTFHREGEVVWTEAEPSKWWSGHPGVVNPGILLAILTDSVVWAASELMGCVPLVPEKRDLVLHDASIHTPLRAEARIVEDLGEHRKAIRAEITQAGETRAVLEAVAQAVTRQRFEAARPLVEIPDSLEGWFIEEAATGPA